MLAVFSSAHAKDHLALAFFKNDKLLKKYSTLDIAARAGDLCARVRTTRYGSTERRTASASG